MDDKWEYPSLIQKLRNSDPKLTTLDFHNNKYLGRGDEKQRKIFEICHALQQNQTVTELNFQHCQLGTRRGYLLLAFEKALKNKRITSLNLASNQIYFLNHMNIALKDNRTLTHLDLSNNKFQREELKTLCEFVKANTALESLFLDSCGIIDEGAQYLLEALLANSNITELSLKYNKAISKKLLEDIDQILAKNTLAKKNAHVQIEESSQTNKRKLTQAHNPLPTKKIALAEKLPSNSPKRFYRFFKTHNDPKTILEKILSPKEIVRQINTERLSIENHKKEAQNLPCREILTLISHQQEMNSIARKPKSYFSANKQEHMVRCGAAGEEATYEMLKDFFEREKNYKIIEEDDLGFKAQCHTSSETKTIYLAWFNKSVWYKQWMDHTPKNGESLPHDIKITKIRQRKDEIETDDPKYPRYIEVKSTTANSVAKAEFTENEFKFLINHNANVWIYRVYNAGQSDCKIKRFRIPLNESILKNEDWNEIEASFTVKI